jgi:hypothetical protein
MGLENAVNTQVRLGGEGLAELAEQLLEVLRPTVRLTMLEVVEAAANEISSQLKGQTVEILIRDGEPELIVSELSPSEKTFDAEDLEARLTLRLPESLKSIIEDNADTSGESINSWVVSALRSKTMTHAGSSVKTTIDI